jgi:hypothetical protein
VAGDHYGKLYSGEFAANGSVSQPIGPASRPSIPTCYPDFSSFSIQWRQHPRLAFLTVATELEKHPTRPAIFIFYFFMSWLIQAQAVHPLDFNRAVAILLLPLPNASPGCQSYFFALT